MAELNPATAASPPATAADPADVPHPLTAGFGRLINAASTVAGICLNGLFILGFFFALRWAQPICLPLTFAILLSCLFRPLIRLLRRVRVPPAIGAALVLGALLGAMALAAVLLAEPAASWMASSRGSFPRIEARLEGLARPVERLSRAAATIERLAQGGGPAGAHEIELHESWLGSALLKGTRSFLGQASVTIILLYLLLASRDNLFEGLVGVATGTRDRARVTALAREAEHRVSKYLATITLLNFGFGVIVAVAMKLVGMPNPLLWGMLAAVFEYVPYIGALSGAAILTVAGMLSFDDTSRALLVPLVYLTLTALEGGVVVPFIVGRSLALHPVAIVVALTLWTWTWGIPGALLSTPLLATIKILSDKLDPLAPLNQILGPPPTSASEAGT